MTVKKRLSFDELVYIFDLPLKKTKPTEWRGACPIHGGDNESALCLNTEKNNWHCYTAHCQEEWGFKINGFLKALLWIEGEEYTSLAKWLAENNLEEIEPLVKTEKIRRLSNVPVICERKQALRGLKIPSKYYLDRGFSEFVLRKFDIGDCNNSRKPMYRRAVIPVYDHNYRWLIGCSGRSIYDNSTWRWRHSKGFPRKSSLYNSWFAKKVVKNTGTIILTEGPAKVWKLEETGIFNSVAIFGTFLHSEQKKLLAKMGVTTIILALDGDAAGYESANKIKQELKDLYSIKIPEGLPEDLDSCSIEEIKELNIENH